MDAQWESFNVESHGITFGVFNLYVNKLRGVHSGNITFVSQ